MTYNFCTLFDRNYLYRGLALHRSLVKHCPDFRLWILSMDEISYGVLEKMNLDKVVLISLKEFEDQELLKIKNSRRPEEYCWTCTPSLPLFILKKYPRLKMIAYLDADLYLYSSPEPIYREFGDESMMIIPHRFPPGERWRAERSGVYNVGMLIFRNDKKGLRCLKWWRKKCLDWCFRHYEEGKYGDQLYLNDWPRRFAGVHVLKHKGANLAPWNISQYQIRKIKGQVLVDGEPLIFYHFHSLKIYSPSKFQPCDPGYKLSDRNKKIIYPAYLRELKKIIEQVKIAHPDFGYGLGEKQTSPRWVRRYIGHSPEVDRKDVNHFYHPQTIY